MRCAFVPALLLTLTMTAEGRAYSQARDIAASLGVLRAELPQELVWLPKVSPVAAFFLKSAKHDLCDLAATVLSRQGEEGTEAAACAREEIVAALKEESIWIDRVGGNPFDTTEDEQRKSDNDEPTLRFYGHILDLDLVSPPGHPDLIVVTFSLDLPCGQDSALYLFRHDVAWHLVFVREANDYEDITHGLECLEWTISPPGTNGAYLIVTASLTTIGCGGNTFRLTWTADRIVPWSDQPLTIDRHELDHGEVLGLIELKAAADRYSLAIEGRFCHDRETRWQAYLVEDDHSVRTDPIADTPDGFVDEWLVMPDDDARLFSALDPEEAASWKKRLDVADDYVDLVHHVTLLTVYQDALPCTDGSWQVHMEKIRFDNTEAENPDDGHTLDTAYFIVSGDENIFRLMQIRTEPRPGCSK